MPPIKITAFTGEQPRIIPRLMPDTAAQSAIDTRLDDGGLTPMKQSTFIKKADASDWKTIYRDGTTWLGWNKVVNAVPGPVATDRLYYTGDGAPKMRYNGSVYALALSRPATALTATLGGSGAGDVVTRTYVYTWVTSLGEESEPNPASTAIDWKPGNSVTLSGFATAPTGRLVTKQRIYRSQTGQSGTYFYLIAERTASDSDFDDDIAVDAFQEALPSASWNEPPAALEGLISLPNGMMAAFVGRDLYFCEPYRPHAWPEKYVLTTDSPIVGLGAMGTSIVVLTEGQPYMAAGTAPESMQMEKVEQNLPCINARGIVDLGYAIAYPSNEGIVVARAGGQFGLATANIFNRQDWNKLKPSTMIGAQLNGRYIAFYSSTKSDGTDDIATLIIDLSGQSFLIRSSTQARGAFYEVSTSSLFYLDYDSDDIRQFDAPDASRLTQYWKSKQFVLPYPENYGAILIDAEGHITDEEADALAAEIVAVKSANAAMIAAGPVGGAINGNVLNANPINGDALTPIPPSVHGTANIGVYADKQLVISVTKLNRPVRLPSGFKARTWEIDVFGDVQILNIAIAKTVDELKVMP